MRNAILWAGVLLAVTSTVRADYADECRDLATRLAADPGALKSAELDLLKNCLSDLQRAILLGQPLPTPAAPAGTVPAEEPVAPVACHCPAPDAACPRREPAAAKPRAPARPATESRRLKPFLPTY